MGRPRFQQRRDRPQRLRVDQGDERSTARLYGRGKGIDEAADSVRRTAHVDKGDLRIAMQEPLRRILRAPSRDGTPASQTSRARQAIPVTGRQNEKAALSMQCGFTAHIKTPGVQRMAGI